MKSMNCPLCQHHTVNSLKIDGRVYRDCLVCRACFLDCENLPTENAARARYLTHSNSLSDAGYVRFLSSVLPLLKQWAPENGAVLDFGCGYAPVLVELLRQAGYDAVGYDSLFFPELPLKSDFDAVVSVETFEHFFQPSAELARIRRLLTPAGILIIKTQIFQPNIDFINWWYIRDFTHTFFYRPETFEWIAQNMGWQILFSDQREHVVLQKIAS